MQGAKVEAKQQGRLHSHQELQRLSRHQVAGLVHVACRRLLPCRQASKQALMLAMTWMLEVHGMHMSAKPVTLPQPLFSDQGRLNPADMSKLRGGVRLYDKWRSLSIISCSLQALRQVAVLRMAWSTSSNSFCSRSRGPGEPPHPSNVTVRALVCHAWR